VRPVYKRALFAGPRPRPSWLPAVVAVIGVLGCGAFAGPSAAAGQAGFSGVPHAEPAGSPAPTPAEVAAGLVAQLVPPTPTMTVVLDLELGRYLLPVRPAESGMVRVRWYRGRRSLGGLLAHPSGLLASGRARVRASRTGHVPLRATRRAKRFLRRARRVWVTALAELRPRTGARVMVTKSFLLR
jgi:hypothetical protein